MIEVNDNFRQLPKSYLFSTVGKKISEFRSANPDASIVRMDIGDITRPLFPCVTEAIRKAAYDMADSSTFRGYGPEQGYDFLREAIVEHDYRRHGIEMGIADVFVSDGAKSDLGNLGDILSVKCKVAVMNPSYPVYVDDNVIDGRAGLFTNGMWSNLSFMDCEASKSFLPEIPEGKVDVIYLCFPNNPTGEAITVKKLQKWVDYARENGSLIIYDSAYEAFVREPGVARSIYECEGARDVAIEVRSYSKTAGFTGMRCGYTVVPRELAGVFSDGSKIELNTLWTRRQTTKFNGASYVSQRAAAAIYTPEGMENIRKATDYYLKNANLIKDAFINAGFKAYGGVNSPYVWAKSPDNRNSWELFDFFLKEAHFSTTPGSGFGTCGEGCLRMTGFNSYENTAVAMAKLKKLS